MLGTSDVARLRVASKCWNEGGREIFLQSLHSDPFAKHWYHDDEGYQLCTLRYPIMESYHKWGLQGSEANFTTHAMLSP